MEYHPLKKRLKVILVSLKERFLKVVEFQRILTYIVSLNLGAEPLLLAIRSRRRNAVLWQQSTHALALFFRALEKLSGS